MEKQVTLIEALDLSIELCIWLAKTGYDCFQCEYTNQRTGNLYDCQGCPLFFLVKMVAAFILMRNGMWQQLINPASCMASYSLRN